MTWFKIDDGFHCHPKVLAAGNAAAGLYVRLGSWCAQQLTDGDIPAHVARTYGRPAELRALVDTRLLVRTDLGYRIPDYLSYNPSAEQVRRERDAAAERQRRAREAAKSRRDSHRDTTVSHGVTTPVSHGPPDPTRPDSSKPPKGDYLATPVENPGGREQEIEHAYLDHARTRAGHISRPTAWEAQVRTTFDTLRPKLRTLLDQFPTAPTATLVHALDTGDTRNLAYYATPDDLATIHELHPPKETA